MSAEVWGLAADISTMGVRDGTMSLLLVIHRYLGVAIGLVMATWCLSGFVMMYQGYPSLTEAERLGGLQALKLDASATRIGLDDDQTVSGFLIEMLEGRPVLRTTVGFRQPRAYDLHSGQLLDEFSPADALSIASTYAAGHALTGKPRYLGLIDYDQWTLEGASARGPVHHVALGDAAGTEVYIGEYNGQVLQDTNARERFWGWLGAVPHWLYPTVLRQNGKLWNDVVVWASLTGCFLTVVGLYIGVARFRKYKSGRWSPYRGWFYWHHIAGLVFGVLTLTWVMSGLFTMNPWGFLESEAGRAQREQLAGQITGAVVKAFLAKAPALAGGGIVELEAAPFGGALFVRTLDHQGGGKRYDAAGMAAPLTETEVKAALAKTRVGPVANFAQLDREDAYYYSGYQRQARFPVYRVTLADAGATALYLDGETGRVARAIDKTARASRWLETGLHDFDFAAALRRRPVWDLMVLVLLAGVTGVCVTGAWLGLKRLARDLTAIGRWIGRRVAGKQTAPTH